MAKMTWPNDLDRLVDRITPYPCQTCRVDFHSTKTLATHKCKPRRKATKK